MLKIRIFFKSDAIFIFFVFMFIGFRKFSGNKYLVMVLIREFFDFFLITGEDLERKRRVGCLLSYEKWGF